MTTTESPDDVAVDLRCSPVARGMGTPVGGSAASFDAVLLIDLPQPWPDKIEEHPLLETVMPVAEELGVRIQGIVPDRDPDAPRQGGDRLRMVLYRKTGANQPGNPFEGYGRVEATVAVDVLGNTLRGLWGHATPEDRTDVLVCAHGKRDRCCGSFGTTIATHATSRGIHALRTSHLGGHRFAPTVLILPQGTCWAWLDDDVFAAIVGRTIEPSALRAHYRGSTGIDHPAAQVVEAEAFFEVGWSWLSGSRSIEVTEQRDGRWRAAVADGTSVWTGIVERTDRLPQPKCGLPIDDASKSDDVLEIIELDRTPVQQG